MPQQHGLWTC
uniref:Uncharacterized protein n=1 Tax=Anguilla anguilla TaxID=7936 RepID=A0A0E9SQX4_ANGAN